MTKFKLEHNYSLDSKQLISTRDAFGEELVKIAKVNKNIVVLTADLAESTRVDRFQDEYPERFFNVGVAEQNLAGISAGLALNGKIPFATTFAAFSPGLNWEQIKISICYSNANVKIIGTHAGLTVGADGATHQSLEDIALTRILPNMTVIYPADAVEATKATKAITSHAGACYLRLHRNTTAVITNHETPFELGKANIIAHGNDVTVVSTGPLLAEVLEAAEQLADEVSINIINLHTIKPIDQKTLIEAAKTTGAMVTVEEHQIAGGMGSAVAEVLSQNYPIPMIILGVKDSFGQSGTPKELLDHYHLTPEDIVEAIGRVLRRKNAR